MPRILHRLMPAASLALFAVAQWILHRQLGGQHLAEVTRYVAALPARRLALAFALTVLGYLVLAGYDWLGFRHFGHVLRFPRVALAAFVGYAFSNVLGHSLLTGIPLRLRLYSAWKISAEDVAKVVLFSLLTFWLGLLTLSGLTFSLSHVSLPEAVHLPFPLHAMGLLFLALIAGFLLSAARRRAPLAWRGFSFELPTPRTALAQIALAAFDLCVVAGVLYALLPPSQELGYFGFLVFYLLALVGGILSMVPGGLGVFESLIVLLLAPVHAAPAVLGALLAFRAVYYLLPLVLAVAVVAGREAWQRRRELHAAARVTARWGSMLVPQALAFSTFLGGAILLVSGATPAVGSRLAWLSRALPLPVIELSHFLGSLAGVGLLLLARGLQRRLDAAYRLTLALLAAGIATSLLKGFDWEEATILALMLLALAPCHGQFRRRAALTGLRFTPSWVTAIAAVFLGAAWLALFAHRHVEVEGELWWRFALSGDAPRALRALVGAATLAVAAGALRLLRVEPPEPDLPMADELDRVEALVLASPRSAAWLALLGDKNLMVDEGGGAFLMYAVSGRSWVALGDPVGPESQARELTWSFLDLCERHNGWPVFYQVADDDLHLYVDLGLSLLKLGEEGRVPLADFSLEGSSRKEFRHAVRKVERDGSSFELLERPHASALLDDLEAISDAWLAEKNTREKGFSLGFFHPAYLARCPLAVVRAQGRVVAFANVWPGGGREELSIDLMRYLPSAPRGVMDYLFVRLMLWGREAGYRWFNLGMAPLSGLEDRVGAPLWNRVAGLIYRHGEHFYNFQGLRQYKDKFDPVWEPRYLASPGGLALPRILTHVTALTSGGIRGIFAR